MLPDTFVEKHRLLLFAIQIVTISYYYLCGFMIIFYFIFGLVLSLEGAMKYINQAFANLQEYDQKELKRLIKIHQKILK